MENIVIEIALETGLRIAEIAALRCGDIHPTDDGGVLFVRRGKGGKSRNVRTGRRLCDELTAFMEWKRRRKEPVDDEAFLFPSSRPGRSLTTRALQKMFARVAARAGIAGRTFHSLRHTYATHLYKVSGNNLRLVQKQLGHASIRTTEIYADVMDEATTTAVNGLYGP